MSDISEEHEADYYENYPDKFRVKILETERDRLKEVNTNLQKAWEAQLDVDLDLVDRIRE